MNIQNRVRARMEDRKEIMNCIAVLYSCTATISLEGFELSKGTMYFRNLNKNKRTKNSSNKDSVEVSPSFAMMSKKSSSSSSLSSKKRKRSSTLDLNTSLSVSFDAETTFQELDIVEQTRRLMEEVFQAEGSYALTAKEDFPRLESFDLFMRDVCRDDAEFYEMLGVALFTQKIREKGLNEQTVEKIFHSQFGTRENLDHFLLSYKELASLVLFSYYASLYAPRRPFVYAMALIYLCGQITNPCPADIKFFSAAQKNIDRLRKLPLSVRGNIKDQEFFEKCAMKFNIVAAGKNLLEGEKHKTVLQEVPVTYLKKLYEEVMEQPLFREAKEQINYIQSMSVLEAVVPSISSLLTKARKAYLEDNFNV